MGKFEKRDSEHTALETTREESHQERALTMFCKLGALESMSQRRRNCFITTEWLLSDYVAVGGRGLTPTMRALGRVAIARMLSNRDLYNGQLQRESS